MFFTCRPLLPHTICIHKVEKVEKVPESENASNRTNGKSH